MIWHFWKSSKKIENNIKKSLIYESVYVIILWYIKGIPLVEALAINEFPGKKGGNREWISLNLLLQTLLELICLN